MWFKKKKKDACKQYSKQIENTNIKISMMMMMMMIKILTTWLIRDIVRNKNKKSESEKDIYKRNNNIICI